MTNKEWLATVSPQEWYMEVHWLFNIYGRRYDNTYLAIIAWLEEKHIEEIKPLPPTDDNALMNSEQKSLNYYRSILLPCKNVSKILSEL